MSTRHRLLLASCATVLALTALPSALHAQTRTAQSVQVHLLGDSQSYNIDIEETCTFAVTSNATAAPLFDSYFSGQNFGANDSQIAAAKRQAFQTNQCNFFNGTTLSSGQHPGGMNHYKWTPLSTDPVASRTLWTCEITGEGATSIDVTIYDIFIASQSYAEKPAGKGGAWSKKFSHTMGDNANSRLTALTIELYKDGVLVPSETRILSTDFSQDVETGADWYYEENGGKFGNAAAIIKLQDGLVNDDIQNNTSIDDFAGNNNTGGSRAWIPDQEYTLILDGDYSLHFTGTIKGNEFTRESQTFSVEFNLLNDAGCD